ncbi:probable inactive serine/threonine-protein kinase fnkC [Impatiens glandulifera]|uniref:probable inactive serine/threonine-protein kinase fnkC n=1 Tax=Impatiens glandulifera TaxID=253017 RepID=UPI001FB051E1|nr:probable inactive serine/threonine-protein kinase fnkC [Impatiens glandulifera]
MGSNFQGQLSQGRDYPPEHFTLRIESFSLMVKSSIHEYVSDQFQVGDYTWKLHIHPNGKKEKGGEGYISLYLELVDTFKSGWPINAVIKFFVLNQINNKYYTTPGPDSVVSFHPLSKLSGIDKFIDLPTFELSSNGYLVDNKCVFGTEVLLVKQDPKLEVLILQDEDSCLTGSYIWKIKSFSSLSLDSYDSEKFTCGDFKWNISLYPRGNSVGKNNSISVYLCLDESTLPNNTKIYVKYRIHLLNNVKLNKFGFTDYHYFNAMSLSWGYPKFMAFDELQYPKNGFLVDDCCSVEAHVTVLGMINTAS